MVELCKKYLRPQEDRIKKVQDISVLEFSSASREDGIGDTSMIYLADISYNARISTS